MKRFLTLAKTEFKLTLRSPDVFLFVLLMPVVIVLLIGLIYRSKTLPGEEGMLEGTYGAFLAIGICAVGLMGLPLALADYREKKILKRLQVTPASPGLLLSAQMLVFSLTAGISALLVAATVRWIFGVNIAGSPLRLITAWIVVLVSIFSIGLVMASTARSVKRIGVIASILYFPMLLLSGTTVPYPVFPETVQKAGEILPLRQGIILLNGVSAGSPLTAYPLQLGVLLGIAVICIAVSLKTFRWSMD